MAYTHMQLLETTVFTRQVQAVLSDESYRLLQLVLLLRPDAGALIPGSAGLRKLRWAAPGRGKRGGVRVVYYWQARRYQIVFLYLYPKNARSTLSAAQLKALRAAVDSL
ncbi:MAG: type II toxin-antitoxin system RelE/ParE family toxin [Gemmatimonadota bacterium]|nr:type II toxin-antitoxin system RelE/ParE family toxin [Gemmatimonadota bacterium]